MKNTVMAASLQRIFVPILRERGFKGSLPHFRRPRTDQIDLLTFQFNRHGGSFVIEVASCARKGIVMPWGKQIPPDKVTAWHVYIHRPRLGSKNGTSNGHWFQFDQSTDTDGVARFATFYLHEAEEFWNCGPKWWRTQ
jgi:hypothetical protein